MKKHPRVYVAKRRKDPNPDVVWSADMEPLVAPRGERPRDAEPVLPGCMLVAEVNFIPLLYDERGEVFRYLENGEALVVVSYAGDHLLVLASGALGWVEAMWLPDMRRIGAG